MVSSDSGDHTFSVIPFRGRENLQRRARASRRARGISPRSGRLRRRCARAGGETAPAARPPHRAPAPPPPRTSNVPSPTNDRYSSAVYIVSCTSTLAPRTNSTSFSRHSRRVVVPRVGAQLVVRDIDERRGRRSLPVGEAVPQRPPGCRTAIAGPRNHCPCVAPPPAPGSRSGPGAPRTTPGTPPGTSGRAPRGRCSSGATSSPRS